MRIKKRIITLTELALVVGILLVPTHGDARGYGHGRRAAGQQPGLSTVVASLPMQDLSPEEEVGIRQMREEEKLARDVYQALYQRWNDQVFANIIRSEQRHMDAVKALIEKYNLPDPVTDPTAGVFTDPGMKELYDKLVAQGSQSLVDALKVGATIEDLDLKDLYELIKTTDNTDIKFVYQNLAKGSRNHLRAFVSRLSLAGVTYQAQYLTQEEINDIITSPRERGQVDENGNQVSGPRGQGRRMSGLSGTQNGCRLLTLRNS